MEKSNNLESKIGYALDILSRANDAMIEVIQQATDENGDKLYYSRQMKRSTPKMWQKCFLMK